jgi:hypothetical protein
MRVTLVRWMLVEDVPGTGGEVVRRVVVPAPQDNFARPVALSRVQVRYLVRAKGGGELIESSGDLSSTFVVTDGPMRGILPCIDAAVRELKKGEKAVLTAPTGWAYASPEYVPPPGGIPTGAVERTSEGVEVELELVDFERGHDFYALSGDEKVAEMTKYREAGNRLFRANFIERCAARAIPWLLLPCAVPTDPPGPIVRLEPFDAHRASSRSAPLSPRCNPPGLSSAMTRHCGRRRRPRTSWMSPMRTRRPNSTR